MRKSRHSLLKLSILLVVTYSSLCNADEYEFLINPEKNNEYLYVSNTSQLGSLDSITYLTVEESVENIEIIETFTYFSDLLGEKNGAVHLPVEKFLAKKNESPNLDFMINSKCKEELAFEKDSVIFENRLTHDCVSIPISEKTTALNILKVIIKNIQSSEKIFDFAERLLLYKAIESDLKEMGIPEENIPIAEKVFVYFKSSYENLIRRAKKN